MNYNNEYLKIRNWDFDFSDEYFIKRLGDSSLFVDTETGEINTFQNFLCV